MVWNKDDKVKIRPFIKKKTKYINKKADMLQLRGKTISQIALQQMAKLTTGDFSQVTFTPFRTMEFSIQFDIVCLFYCYTSLVNSYGHGRSWQGGQFT